MHPLRAIQAIREIAAAHGLCVKIYDECQPTPCQVDILGVLRDAQEPLTTPMVLAELDRRRQIWGERTVAGALAALVRAGLITASRRAPRGYRIAQQH